MGESHSLRNHPGGLSMTQQTARPGRQTCTAKVGAAEQSMLVRVALPISHTCHFLPRILTSWTFPRETFWRSSWKGRMAGGLWNETDNVALSLGHTWRSSEERLPVPAYLCPDHEGQDCSHHCPGLKLPEPSLAGGSGWAGCWLLLINFSQE